MVSPSQQSATFDDHRSDDRVRAGSAQPFPRLDQREPHPGFVTQGFSIHGDWGSGRRPERVNLGHSLLRDIVPKGFNESSPAIYCRERVEQGMRPEGTLENDFAYHMVLGTK
jgi:hypothetical protein